MGGLYQINLNGAIYLTNANVPQITPTSFIPVAAVSRSGNLVIEAPIPNANRNPSNGSTLAEVGIFSGSESDFISGLGGAGTLRFTTNTLLHTEFSGGSAALAIAALEITRETFDPSTQTLDIQLDSNLAPSNSLNGFLRENAGILTEPEEIISGDIKIQFSADRSQIAGTITLLGNGYANPGVYAYAAQFTGNFVQSYQGIAESGVSTVSNATVADNLNDVGNAGNSLSPQTTSASTPLASGSTPTILITSAPNQTLRAGNTSSVLNGQAGHDVLIGGLSDDSFIAGPGDTLTGGKGADRFTFTGKTKVVAFANSPISSPVHITDFNSSEGDRLDITVGTGQTQPVLPSHLYNAGIEKTHTLKQAIQDAYSHKLSSHHGNYPLKANEAVFLKWHQQVYLAVKGQHGGGFAPKQDLVINMTGINLQAGGNTAGVIPVSNYFV